MTEVQPIDIPIIGPSNKVPQDDPEFTLNLYGEKVSDEVYTLKPTPGTELEFALSYNGGGRGEIVANGRFFAVRGAFLIERVDGVNTYRGTLESTTGKVGMICNGNPTNSLPGQIMIVDDEHGYVLNLDDNTFETLLEVDGFVGGGSQLAFCAGRAIALKPDSAQWQYSALYDFSVWTGVDSGFATCLSLLNGKLQAVLSNGDFCYFWSQYGMEVWQQIAGDTLPMRRILAADKIGIMAKNSAFYIGRYAYWLGGTAAGRGVVYRHAGGGQPERISDHSTERNIAAIADASDGNALYYESLGHVFYLLTFKSGNRTFCFDATTGLWHDRAIREPINGSIQALPYIAMVFLDGKILALDSRNGNVYSVKNDVYTDNGNPIIRDRILSVIPKEADWPTFFQSVELMGQVGNTPAGEDDPNVFLRYSLDRGMTYSEEDWKPMGGQAGYETRIKWNGLGSGIGLALWFRTVASQYISWRSVRLRAQ